MFLLPKSKQSLFLLFTSCLALLFGILMFLQGFFLAKISIFDVSQCSSTEENCKLNPVFRRSVVLLIDGLRHDFAAFDKERSHDSSFFINKMPVFDEIIRNCTKAFNSGTTDDDGMTSRGGGWAFLSQFVADAPTTTLQRLTALTTGSLPTYFDFVYNFGSPELQEDNIIKQVTAAQYNVTVLGDDTWGSVFPNSLTRSFLYPSFNVRDLDTVDNGVLTHLYDEMERRDAHLLIAHFLGVDHAGHTYGTQHVKMADKLKQMNEVVRLVAQKIDEETILFVIGDHGMTSSGDHGGDSEAEVTAALFAYSPALRRTPSTPQVIPQVSFVPTLSLLLGLPVPFNNIGGVITELFGEETNSALRLNVNQVHRYMKTYQDASKSLPKVTWKNLSEMKEKLDALEKIEYESFDEKNFQKNFPEISLNSSISYEKAISSYKRKTSLKYLLTVKAMCDEVWATFDINGMLGGIFLMVVSIVNMVTIALSLGKSNDNVMFFNKGNLIFLGIMILTLYLKHMFHIPVLNYIPAFLSGTVVVFHFSRINPIVVYGATKEQVPLIIFLLFCLSNFSNSFIVNEGSVSSFVVTSLFLFQLYKIGFNHREKFLQKDGQIRNSDKIQTRSLVLSGFVTLVSCCGLRASHNLYRCREEQEGYCQDNNYYQPLSAVDASVKNTRFLLGIVSLFLVGYLPRMMLMHCGNLNGNRVAVLFFRYSGHLLMFLIVSYWSLESMPKPSEMIIAYLNTPPRAVYVSSLLMILLIFLKPLMIYHLQKTTSHSFNAETPKLLIAELYNTLKTRYDEKDAGDSPVVYGLATGLSAPSLAVVGLVLFLAVLVVGPALSLGLVSTVVLMVSCCLLHSILCWQIPTVDSILRLRWLTPITWACISIQGFYSLGHQMTLNTIPWLAAFVGFLGESGGGTGVGGNYIPAALIGFHTFSSYIILGVAFPLLLLAPVSLAVLMPSFRKTSQIDELRKGEFTVSERPDAYIGALTTSATAYIALHAIKVLFSCLACLFLRRHLMLWKVFAPHFIFEALGLVVTMFSVWLGLLLSFRILTALCNWAEDITLLKGKNQ